MKNRWRGAVVGVMALVFTTLGCGKAEAPSGVGPNNDTLYISCLLDLRKDPVILDIRCSDRTTPR